MNPASTRARWISRRGQERVRVAEHDGDRRTTRNRRDRCVGTRPGRGRDIVVVASSDEEHAPRPARSRSRRPPTARCRRFLVRASRHESEGTRSPSRGSRVTAPVVGTWCLDHQAVAGASQLDELGGRDQLVHLLGVAQRREEILRAGDHERRRTDRPRARSACRRRPRGSPAPGRRSSRAMTAAGSGPSGRARPRSADGAVGR